MSDKWRVYRNTYPRSGHREDPQGFYSHWYVDPPEEYQHERSCYDTMTRFDTWRDGYNYAFKEATRIKMQGELYEWVSAALKEIEGV